MQDHHVIEGRQQHRIRDSFTTVSRNLRNDDLSLWGDSDDLVSVARGDTGDVRAVGARRGNIRIIVGVVVGEGELLIQVDPGCALTQLRCQRGDILGSHCRLACERARECRMGGIDARINDGDDLTLTLLGYLVDVHHQLGVEVVRVLAGQARGRETALGIHCLVRTEAGLTLDERALDAAHRTDRIKGAGGHVQSEAREGIRVLALHLGGGAGERAGHGLVNGGQCDIALHPVLKLDDNSDDRRGILSPVIRVWHCHLAALRCQRSINIAHERR